MLLSSVPTLVTYFCTADYANCLFSALQYIVHRVQYMTVSRRFQAFDRRAFLEVFDANSFIYVTQAVTERPMGSHNLKKTMRLLKI